MVTASDSRETAARDCQECGGEGEVLFDGFQAGDQSVENYEPCHLCAETIAKLQAQERETREATLLEVEMIVRSHIDDGWYDCVAGIADEIAALRQRQETE